MATEGGRNVDAFAAQTLTHLRIVDRIGQHTRVDRPGVSTARTWSYPVANALFSVVDPCPQTTIKGANPETNPMALSELLANAARSSSDKPTGSPLESSCGAADLDAVS